LFIPIVDTRVINHVVCRTAVVPYNSNTTNKYITVSPKVQQTSTFYIMGLYHLPALHILASFGCFHVPIYISGNDATSSFKFRGRCARAPSPRIYAVAFKQQWHGFDVHACIVQSTGHFETTPSNRGRGPLNRVVWTRASTVYRNVHTILS